MIYVIVVIVISVFIRRFMPARGFFCDDVIEFITRFGDDNKITLKSTNNLEKVIEIQTEENTSFNTNDEFVNEGVDLTDIKGKDYSGVEDVVTSSNKSSDVNTDYIYSNLDDSDEGLSDTIGKVLSGRK